MARIFSIKERSEWNPNSPERQQQIIRLLEEVDMGFNELLSELNLKMKALEKKQWSRQTLTLYLKALEDKKWIIHGKKRTPYSLNRRNPEVAEMLGWNRIPPDMRIRSRIELDKLDEEQFIANWLNSVKFSFLNIIQDFMLIGAKGEKLEIAETIEHRFLPAHTQDLIDVLASYGEKMIARIKLGTFDPNRVWEARNRLLEQIRNEFMSRARYHAES